MRMGPISLSSRRAGAVIALLLAMVLPAQMVLAPVAYAAPPIPPPPPPPAGTLYESDYGTIAYAGTWNDVIDSGASGGFYRNTTSAGSGTVTFMGTEIALVAKKGPAFGQMNVSLDGAPAVSVDLYSASAASLDISRSV